MKKLHLIVIAVALVLSSTSCSKRNGIEKNSSNGLSLTVLNDPYSTLDDVEYTDKDDNGSIDVVAVWAGERLQFTHIIDEPEAQADEQTYSSARNTPSWGAYPRHAYVSRSSEEAKKIQEQFDAVKAQWKK